MIATALRVRARETYRKTAQQAGDRSWADFLETAILREVERRERSFNNGDPFPIIDEQLRPGRGNRRLFG
ncbi:hypothetical protein ACFQ9V_17555 [Leifsonia sp. NPDC056665]|uniref:ParB family protein n=1 Tax=Leifsonia sp. NPDC056665 TaxID=3345901 RepID=UPI00369C507C